MSENGALLKVMVSLNPSVISDSSSQLALQLPRLNSYFQRAH